MTITFSIRVESTASHRAAVVLQVDGVTTPSFDLVLPSWVPGSYEIKEYARTIRDVAARAVPGGTPLRVERTDKARWRVHSAGAGAVEVRYEVHGYGMITEAFDVTADHLFVNAAYGLPYVDGRQDEPYEVALEVAADWKIYTELQRVGESPARFRARDYHELLDSPIDCGHPVVLDFHAGGIPHRIVLCGHGGNYEGHRLEEDFRKIAEAAIRLFGGSPLRHYTFFYHLSDVSDGALEHANSNSAVLPRTAFRPLSAYHRALWTASHEYVHLYLVKRIRPVVLEPFDYTREVYTKLLWAMEGTTDYYGLLLLRRAGLLGPSKFLEKLANEAHVHLGVPGRRVRSLEESSFLAWVDLYKPNEESRNWSESYYRKGLLVSFCLDLEIRHRTENRASLDTVLNALWVRFSQDGRGVGEEELLPIASAAVGLDLAPFFARYVSGTDEVDFSAFARYAGLSFGSKAKPPDPEGDGEPGWLGLEHTDRDGRVRVTSVLDGGPARRAGVSPGDEIVAIDRHLVTPEEFPKALMRLPAGTAAELSVFRRGWLTTIPITTGVPPPEKHEFTALETATPLERAIYESWLGSKWEPSPKKDPAEPGR
ncbi:MAG TPA: PDZ domain-containing protein [Thermoplasmata archaeon]